MPGRGAARTLRLPIFPGATVFAAMRPPRFLAREKRARHARVWPCLLLLLYASFAFFAGHLRAEEPFFKKGDVIAIVGGEDMVALSEYGYLELLLTRALPDYHLRFRNLAQEGDTVFEQRRDLNFPTWEEALEKIGATVVLCQFGQMESLAGKEKLPEFIAAYEKLLGRLSGGGKRRVILLGQTPVEDNQAFGILTPDRFSARERDRECNAYTKAAEEIAQSHGYTVIDLHAAIDHNPPGVTRDSLHLNDQGHKVAARSIGDGLSPSAREAYRVLGSGLDRPNNPELHRLLALIIAKNRLWFDYWRVQNWAFLAGDRTNQPSSRDHLDPTKRWFPEERERFLPLIEAKEREIDAQAEKLAQP